jgi:antitoxin FitA
MVKRGADGAAGSVRGSFGACPAIHIRNVPPDVHAILRRRAAAAGQSLETYLLGLLTRDAREPSRDEVRDRVAAQSGGSVPFGAAAETIRSDRGRA